MKRRDFLRATAAGTGAWALGWPGKAGAAGKPNIVFILIDDMGWMDIGVNGSDFYETPNIDRLASQGMRFTDAYAACPVCSPTRASIMTGKYPARLHLTDFIAGKAAPFEKLKMPEWTKYLPSEEETIAERLKAAGYTTGCIGKWHLEARKLEPGVDPALTKPEAQGFDVAQDYPSQNMKENDPKSIFAITEHSLRFIEENKDRPFFLYMAHHTVHLAIEARKELVAKYEAKKPGKRQSNPVYAGMAEHTDDSVGQVLAKLDALGLTDNTLVIFFSDNGGFSYVRGKNPAPTNNAPLRLGKGSLYEGATRVPFIVRWPGVVPAGKVCGTPVISVDFYPTLLAAAGAEEAPGHVPDGVSILPLLKGGDSVGDRALFWHYPHYHHTAPGGMVRLGDFKLIENYEDGSLELYNLADDIGETKDLSREMPEKARELRARLQRWREEAGAQMPTENPDYDAAKAGSYLTEL